MNPQSKLTLNGDMMLTGYLSPATGSRFIGIDRNQDSNIKGSWIEFESLGLGFGDGQSIHFGTHHSGFSNARRMTILNTGNVGVGTTSPVAGLHVHTASGIAGLRLESGNSSALFKMKGGGADPEESVWQLNTFSSSGTGYFRLSAVNDAENAAVQAIEIKRSLGTAVESVTFPSGNIGIGTTTPGYLLHVNSGATPTSSQVRLTVRWAPAGLLTLDF